MTRISLVGLVLMGGATLAACWGSDPAPPKPVTFYKDVLPILKEKCLSCHSPGGMAPMSFATYRETKPWVHAIRSVALGRRMPPFTADARNYHHFLTPHEIQVLVTWVNNGAPRGDPKDAPPFEEWAFQVARY